VTIDVSSLGIVKIESVDTLSDDDPYAKNTLHDQNRVKLLTNTSASMTAGVVTIALPPISWTALSLVR